MFQGDASLSNGIRQSLLEGVQEVSKLVTLLALALFLFSFEEEGSVDQVNLGVEGEGRPASDRGNKDI